MSRQSQCSGVLQAPSRTVGFTRRFHTLSSIHATNTSPGVSRKSPVVVHTSLRSRTLGQTASVRDRRPLGCDNIYSVLHRHLEYSPTRVMHRGGLRGQPVPPEHSCVIAKCIGNSSRRVEVRELNTMSAYTRQKAKSNYRYRIRLERVSQKQSSDTHKTPYDRVKRCRERKINIMASERVNVDDGAELECTIPTCEALGVNAPGVDPGSPWPLRHGDSRCGWVNACQMYSWSSDFSGSGPSTQLKPDITGAPPCRSAAEQRSSCAAPSPCLEQGRDCLSSDPAKLCLDLPGLPRRARCQIVEQQGDRLVHKVTKSEKMSKVMVSEQRQRRIDKKSSEREKQVECHNQAASGIVHKQLSVVNNMQVAAVNSTVQCAQSILPSMVNMYMALEQGMVMKGANSSHVVDPPVPARGWPNWQRIGIWRGGRGSHETRSCDPVAVIATPQLVLIL
ncbi:hypothetical protein PR048_026308 [Dryococelus australis]|uniref:Uncharacterized protein n=1 Tax=Dryococelus australis TaxID=614101 RepID=A0ABQ9GL06_9NEOP|nr:hypothetical protein PR048_026308 [Dryococelus australis]